MAVRFVSSYRSQASFVDGLRRFEVGHRFGAGADVATDRHVYFCKDSADADALQSYFDAEAVRWPSWATHRGICPVYPMPSVVVDLEGWHVLVYGAPAVAS